MWASAQKGFAKQVGADKNGTKPLYRPRTWKFKERLAAKQAKTPNWYKRKELMFDSFMMIPSTPGSALKRILVSVVKNSDYKLRVVERPGPKLIDAMKVIIGKNTKKAEQPYEYIELCFRPQTSYYYIMSVCECVCHTF